MRRLLLLLCLGLRELVRPRQCEGLQLVRDPCGRQLLQLLLHLLL
jgi:hypothetical protein